MAKNKPLIGFIGQGYIGKNYADDFEARGFTTVRFSLEEPYVGNKEKIKECDYVFIAVPTPTTPKGFDDSIVRSAIGLVGAGKTAIIKSTIVPGTTKSFQDQYPDRNVVYSPEFLSEATAAHDAAHPFANIIGLTRNSDLQKKRAEELHSILPKAPFTLTCSSTEAELVKYSHNGSGYAQIIFFNLMYDLAQKHGANWNSIQRAIEADPMISSRYARPVHKSGRGAGGHCFIKDVAALRAEYGKHLDDKVGLSLFETMEQKNIELLRSSGKDLDLLSDVYGEKVLEGAPEKTAVPKLGSVRGDVRLLLATEAVDTGDPLLGFFHRWIEEFGRHSSRVHVIALGAGERNLGPNIFEHSLGKESATGSRIGKRIRYTLRFIRYAWKYRNEYEDVLIHLSPEYILIGGLLWKLLGKRIAFWYNDAESPLRVRLAIALSDVLFYTDPRSYAANFPHGRKIPMGVDVEMYESERRAPSPSLLFLGRITPKKRLDVVLAALDHLSSKGAAASLDVYGATGMGDESHVNALHAKFGELERTGVLTFKGTIPHAKTPAVYASHDIFVHLGSRRGFNKTVLEAMASGCIVITADPSLKGVVNDRLFVEKLDEEHVSRAIEAALSLSGEEREKERIQLHAYVRRENSLSSVVPIMLEMLRRKGGEAGE